LIDTIEGDLNGKKQDEDPVNEKIKLERAEGDAYAGMDSHVKWDKCGALIASVDPGLNSATQGTTISSFNYAEAGHLKLILTNTQSVSFWYVSAVSFKIAESNVKASATSKPDTFLISPYS
jgi:hypothetical protein